MRNSLLDETLGALVDGLWHTTSIERFNSIREDGAILANPNLDESERWKTSRGPEYYPFVRKLGGVSLFDFHGFDTEEYDRACPMSSWRRFVPFQKNWSASVWLELERASMNGRFIEPRELWRMQHEQGAHRHTLMPRIEAAYIGDLTLCFCSRALQINDEGIKDLDLLGDETERL